MPRRAAGFTLVELILAATVTTLVTVAATLVLRGVTEADRRIERQSQLAAEARAAVNTIAAALRNAYRPTDERERLRIDGFDDAVDEFPRDRLRFFTVSHTPVRPGQPESDVREVEFSVLDPGDGSLPALVRRLDPTRNDDEDGGGVLERIASGVLAFNATYHDGTEYVDDWPEAMGWPAAIRLELVVAPTEGEGQPLIVTRTVALAHGYTRRGGASEGSATPMSEQDNAGRAQQQQPLRQRRGGGR